jgi:phosphoribosylformimino-5-aminoimidazole carboxamide ribotide isomerase
MRIIPAIDIIDGKCVRLTQGDYSQKKIYSENPLEVAKEFEDSGVTFLHLVDLDGAKAGEVQNWKVVEAITKNTNLSVDFGGGIKTEDEISRLLDLGINQVNLGSIAIRKPYKIYEWAEKFGFDKIILSADVKNEEIAISGWLENSSVNIMDFVKGFYLQGIRFVTCTDISVDGMLTGPNIDLYKKLLNEFDDLKLIASGGVGNVEDVNELVSTGVHGVIIGKAIYEGRINLKDLKLIQINSKI